MAALPTPDPPACTSTVSAGRTSARATSMCHAVSMSSGSAAASANDNAGGLRIRLRMGTAIFSAQPPWRVSPKMPWSLWQSGSLPERQATQSPQEYPGATSTSSPACHRSFGAISSMTPATSAPGIIGSENLWPGTPRRTQMSR